VTTESAHQEQRKAPPEPALAVADRERESTDDQPHRALGKAAEHPAQGLVGIGIDIAHDTGKGQSDQPDSTDRHRFQDQACDDTSEDREVVPLIGIQTRWNGYQVDHEPHNEWRNRLPGNFQAVPLPVSAARGVSFRPHEANGLSQR
jgi:hypothetical protein